MKTRETVVAVVLLLAFYACVAHVTGCGWLPGDTTTQAELAYRAELLRCVDAATTLAESKACRKSADAKWNVDGGAK